jgi:uncharacterized protein (DUF1697 family)
MTDTRYVALLKGINVGKAKRIAMADLRAILTGLGYGDVITHLQSGNAAFTLSSAAGPHAADTVGTAIERGLVAELGVDARVVVRTHRQLVEAVAADPFADLADDPSKHILGFFSDVPTAAKVSGFEAFVAARDLDPEVAGLHSIDGDHCYLWCPQGVSKSLFGTVDWDRKLGVAVTMRNWSTALKLVEMSG